MWTGLLSRLRVTQTIEERHRISAQVLESSTPHAPFYLMVVLSTTIATFGLLANSTAIVIGAMLVAPLMGPIFGIALSLANGSRRLLARAAVSEAAGVLLCIVLSALIGLVAAYASFGSEILGRTKPTLYDIIVALASGVAGAYALVDKKISPALPGVAIATALVPPLTTCGLCLAAAQWDWALGAFLLFFANFLAIEVAAAVVFLLAGMGKAGPSERFTARLLLRRFGLSIGLLAAVAVFMTHTLVSLVSETRFSETLKRALSTEVRSSVGAHLTDIQFERASDRTDVIAVVLTPQEFGPEQVAKIEGHLRRTVDPGIRLVIRSLLSKDADDNGAVFVTPEDHRRRTEALEQTTLLSTLSQRLKQGLAEIPGARLVDVRQEKAEGQLHVSTLVHTPTPIEPTQVARLETALRAGAGLPVRLTVRSVLTREADAERFLYAPAGQPPPTEEDREFARRLEEALAAQLHRQDRSAALVEHRFVPRGDRLLVLATVRVRVVLTPRQVSRMETGLRRTVDPKTDLVVRSTVGADTTRSAYLASFDETQLVPFRGPGSSSATRAPSGDASVPSKPPTSTGGRP